MSTSANQPFMPKYGSGQMVSPGATSAVADIDPSNRSVRVVNAGANIGFFRTYSSRNTPAAVALSVADMAVPPGGIVTVSKDTSHDKIAFISAAGTTFYIITGEGW